MQTPRTVIGSRPAYHPTNDKQPPATAFFVEALVMAALASIAVCA